MALPSLIGVIPSSEVWIPFSISLSVPGSNGLTSNVDGSGTGNPFVTTDTGAALRCAEIGADVLLKATKVDGVYTADPVTDTNAKRIERLSFNEVIDKRLKVMDVSAVDMCQRNRVPIIVLDVNQPGNMRDVVQGKNVGTLIDGRAS